MLLWTNSNPRRIVTKISDTAVNSNLTFRLRSHRSCSGNKIFPTKSEMCMVFAARFKPHLLSTIRLNPCAPLLSRSLLLRVCKFCNHRAVHGFDFCACNWFMCRRRLIQAQPETRRMVTIEYFHLRILRIWGVPAGGHLVPSLIQQQTGALHSGTGEPRGATWEVNPHRDTPFGTAVVRKSFPSTV